MKSEAVQRFDRTADGYLRWWAPMLAPASVRMIDRLDRLDPGLPGGLARDVLDLGCGTGSGLFEAARRWPGARLTGLDASVGMLAVARREGAGLSESISRRIGYVEGDAEELPVPDGSFDVVMSGFVLQQVPLRATVLREVRRALRPNGIVAISGWLVERKQFPAEAAIEEGLADAGVVRPIRGDVRSGPYRSARTAAAEMRAAGFRRVAAREDRLDYPWTVEDYIAYRTTTRDLPLFEALDEPTRLRAVTAIRRRLSGLGPAQLVHRAPTVSIVARRG
jgi:ubiquinone/menaquinone biosynthesis C-methylase UbiE